PAAASPVPKDLSQETSKPPPLDRAAARATYPWLDDPGALEPVDRLRDRFPPPPGLRRRDAADGTFAAYLRDLPLAAAGTPVRSFAGATILAGDHPNLAAVVAIDVGDGDLQQCADSIIRLHAEWLFTAGRDAQSYKSASGLAMPFRRYLAGDRLVYQDKALTWEKKKGPQARTHALLRAYLRGVFAWANTASLAQEAAKVERDDLRAGDFFVLGGFPGHAVLVLDVAEADDGRRALLLGQGYLPAQSFHVLRPGPGQSPWFVVDPAAGGIKTPFWETFPWSSIRRLDRDDAR
ncbi:MAG: DUF4846 domain-containing protein, partial [Nannocystaceae bacterium]